MKKFINGKYIELTPEEITAMQKEAARAELAEKSRPLTEAEVSRMLITQQINTLPVDDNTALRMKTFYPEWKDLVGQTVEKAGYKFQYGDYLYKTIPANHTFQADWIPGNGTESLYTRIDETHSGTADDPIPYDGNMALESGKHYMQDYVIYLCIRDTVNPVYNPLAELVRLYVEEI
jgi:hypothetical protein